MFFPSDNIFKCQDNDMIDMITLETAQQITDLHATNKLDNEIKNYNSELINHICTLRASNLLLMQGIQDFGFLDGTTSESIIEDCFKKPENIIRHISPKISQSLGLFISFIHSSPHKFADLLLDYFSKDMTLGASFAYSTFPSLYGYFATSQFNMMGSKIIVLLLNKPEMLELSCLMIASYLHTQHKFIYAIFSGISEGWAKAETGADYLLVLAAHISRALRALGSIPAMVLKNLYITNLDAFVRTMAVEFLLPLTIAWGRYGKFRSDTGCLEELAEILRHIGDNPNSIEGQALRAAFSECEDAAVADIPTLPPPDILPRISLVFSDRDITVLTDIISINPPNSEDGFMDIDTLISCAQKTFKKGYTPFFILVISPIERMKSIKNHSADRSINVIIQRAQDSGRILLDYILNPPYDVSSSINDDVRYSIFKEILKKADYDYQILNELFSIGIMRQELNEANKFAEISVELQIYHRTDMLLASKTLKAQRMNLNTILSEKHCMPNPFALAAVVAYLDRLRPKFTNQMKTAIEIYKRIVKTQSQYQGRLWKFVYSILVPFKATFKLGYGSILCSVIHVAGLLNQITGDPIEWSDLFEAILCEVSPKATFQAFVVFRDYLLENCVIASEWDQQTNIKFTSAFSVFRKFLMQEPKLSQIFELSALIL